jgi:hypothetical protein
METVRLSEMLASTDESTRRQIPDHRAQTWAPSFLFFFGFDFCPGYGFCKFFSYSFVNVETLRQTDSVGLCEESYRLSEYGSGRWPTDEEKI